MQRGGVTTEGDILAVLRGRMDYPTLLERLREANRPVCGVMTQLERLRRQSRVKLTDRHGRPWVNAYFGVTEDHGPMFIESTPESAEHWLMIKCGAIRLLRRMIEEGKIVLPWRGGGFHD